MYFVFDKMPGPMRWLGKDYQRAYWSENNIWWDDGVPFAAGQIHEPLTLELQPVRGTWDHGDRMQAYFKDAHMPIMRDDLIAVMQDAGADNLDLYDTLIIDPETGNRFTNYKAVNIIGLISSADWMKPAAGNQDDVPRINAPLDRSNAEHRTINALIIRMAESEHTILVHKQLARRIIQGGFERDILLHDMSTVGIL